MVSSRSARPQPKPPLVLVLGAVGVAAVFAAPLVYVLWRNIELGSDFFGTLTESTTIDPLRRSLWLGFTVAFAAAVLGTTLAWLTVRSDIPLRRLLRGLAPLSLVFPSFVGATALRAGFTKGGLVEELLSPLGVDSLPIAQGFWAAWLVLTLFTFPYVFLPVAARLASLPPSLEESASLLGRRGWAVFTSVVLPQTRGAIAAGALLVFLYTISDFGAVALLGYDTLTEQIYADRLFDQARAMALSLVLGLVALVVVLSERTMDSRSGSATIINRSRQARQVQLGSWRWPSFALVALALLLALFAPLGVLGFWAWRGLRSNSDSIALRTDIGDLMGPLINSVETSLITSVVAVAVVLPIAWLSGRHRSKLGSIANTLVVGSFALPGVVVALSVAFWALDLPLIDRWYQTLPLLIVAYVIHFGAQATRAANVAVTSLPANVSDAARTLGAGRFRRFFTVELPLMGPGLLAGAGLVLLSTMKELPATLIMAPTGFDTLATEIWSATERQAFAQAGLASVILVVISGILTWAVVIRRIDHY